MDLAEEAHLLVAALITIGGSISSRITKPLRELGSDMAELGKGSWQPTKAHSGAIEIADLLTGYNAMVDSLHALTDEITREQIEKRKIKVAMLQSQLDLLCDGVNLATDALQSAVFQGRGRNLYYEAGVPGSKAQLKALDDGVAKVREALKSGDEALLMGEMRRLYQRELQGMMQYNYLSHVNALLMGILTQTCLAGDIPFRSIFGADTVSLEALDEMDTIADICGWFVDHFSALSRAVSTSYSPRLSQIIRYIDQHYCEDLTLEGLASTFLIHKVYLAKVFKAETGLSVGEYIRNKRMERAQAMLAREDVRIGEVVDKLGFHNAQTLYNLFKRCVGMSPSEYKALCEMRRVNQSIYQSKEDVP